jgi:hypothetical protein
MMKIAGKFWNVWSNKCSIIKVQNQQEQKKSLKSYVFLTQCANIPQLCPIANLLSPMISASHQPLWVPLS